MAPVTTAPASARGTAYVFDHSWQATPNNVTRARKVVADHAASFAVDETALRGIVAAVAEAATNAVYHAYVGRRIGRFRVTGELRADELIVAVEDDGRGFEPETVTPGAGLPLIAAFALRVETTARETGGMRTAMVFARA